MIDVSIIVPVYNKERFLVECMECLIHQTYRNIEIICVDDGSADSSLKILEEYAAKDSRVVVIPQKNQGAGNARNTGIKHAKGRYMQFLDADDFFDLDMVEKMLAKADEENADIVLCNALQYNHETKVEEAHKWLNVKGFELDVFSYKDVGNIFNITTPSIWNKLYKRELILDNNITYQEIQSNNDTAFSVITLLLAKRITYVNEYFVHYRYYQDTFRISSSREKHMNCSVMAYERIIQVMKENGILEEVMPLLNYQMYNSANYELSFCKDEEEARRFIRKISKLMTGPDKMKLLYKKDGFTNMRSFFLFGKIPVLTSVNLAKKKVFYFFNKIPITVEKRK